MRDRNGTNDLTNGAVRYGAYDASGNLLRHEWVRPEDEPLEVGTPLNKASLLSDETAAAVWPAGDAPSNPTVDDALSRLTEPYYKIGDILTTVRTLAAPWHECDGATFSQTQYPALYAVLGGTTLPTINYSDDSTTYIKMAEE